MTTRFQVGSATDVGQVRSINQDSKLVGGEVAVYAVADGMGGHQGGEVASAIAVETLEATLLEATADAVVEAVREANRRIYSRAADTPELRGMGTTLVAIALVDTGRDDEEVAWVNVGDSRAYMLRDGSLEQLSRDHSLVEDLRRGGQLTDDEAAAHPQRNIVTRALGIDPDVEVDSGAVIPRQGDRFLLCSDGLTNEVDLTTLVATLESVEDPHDAAEELVRLANEGGGRDNITCVVADVVDDGRRAAHGAALTAVAGAGTAGGAGDEDPTTVEAIDGAVEGDAALDVTEVVTTPPAAPGAHEPEPGATEEIVAPSPGDDPTAPGGRSPVEDNPDVPADAARAGATSAAAPPSPHDDDATPPAGLPRTRAPAPPPEQPDRAPPSGRTPTTSPRSDPTTSSTASATTTLTGARAAASPAEVEDALPFGRDTNDVYGDMDHARGRHRVLGVLAALLVLGGLAAGAYFGLSWYAYRTWFVSTGGTEVILYRGQPGGFLIFEPKSEARSGHELGDFPARDQDAIEAERTFSSEAEGRSFLNRLINRAEQDDEPTTTTTEAPTSTTRSRATTTTAPGGGTEGDATVSSSAERPTTTEGR